MRALLVIDVQNVLVEQVDFHAEKERIKKLISEFKQNDEPVIFVRHTDAEGPMAAGSKGSELDSDLVGYADHIVEKHTESAFFETNLDSLLKSIDVNHIFITGFNTEFCCLFTSIAGYDRGYKVTFIENAVSTVHTEDNYKMPGLNIREFIGTILYWSHKIEVLDYEEYAAKK
ncbi:isochorismatase family cysteine hydrolase [Virgibacillus flavescens]|uniref:isochorismatase family cysteine hydrolase n=1 Tax=Virgibacillus flavescens TaxID=1611422 RepID=UPI003D340F62